LTEKLLDNRIVVIQNTDIRIEESRSEDNRDENAISAIAANIILQSLKKNFGVSRSSLEIKNALSGFEG
jgi:hypothetical protein